MEERKKKWRMIWVGSGIQFWKCCIFLLICRGPDPATVPMEMQNELENDVPRWISTSQKQLYAVCERRKGFWEAYNKYILTTWWPGSLFWLKCIQYFIKRQLENAVQPKHYTLTPVRDNFSFFILIADQQTTQ